MVQSSGTWPDASQIYNRHSPRCGLYIHLMSGCLLLKIGMVDVDLLKVPCWQTGTELHERPSPRPGHDMPPFFILCTACLL